MTKKYLLGWFILLVAAIINGAAREALYKQALGDLGAHQLSTLTGILLFAVLIWGMSRIWPIPTPTEAWRIGILWLLMTIGFEFLFGHFVMGHSWEKLFYDYNILEGRVWVLVLIWTLVAPRVFYQAKHR